MARPKSPLTDRDYETLGDIISAVDQRAKYYQQSNPTHSDFSHIGVKPLDFGGSNGSHHSVTASKLVNHGMAEHRKNYGDWGKSSTHYRGSKQYRPTDAGRLAFAAWREAKRATS